MIVRDSGSSLQWREFFIFISIYSGVLALLIFSNHLLQPTQVGRLLSSWYFYAIPVFLFQYLIMFVYRPIREFLIPSFKFSVLKDLGTYVFVFIGLLINFLVYSMIFGEKIGWFWMEVTSPLSAHVEASDLQLILFVACNLVFVPLYEEALFRGILQRFLSHKFNWGIGLVVSAILFGSLHVVYPIFGVVMGLVFGSLYQLKKSIIPSILCHGIWNLFIIFYTHEISVWDFM